MKAVILAGGFGTRISEESHLKPKPMIEIGGKPILWHIMKQYSFYGINEFVICLGYRGYFIKEYFANYFLHMSDVTFDLQKNEIQVHDNKSEPWRVTLIDTGMHSQTGGRLKRVKDFIGDEDFCFTYGDGVSNVNIKHLIDFHQKSGKLATMIAAQPPGRFGALAIGEDNLVSNFHEKPVGDGGWINGGFFVLSPQTLNYIAGDDTSWEKEPLETLAKQGQLQAWFHHGFWQPMDTMRDKAYLEQLCMENRAPWKVWEQQA